MKLLRVFILFPFVACPIQAVVITSGSFEEVRTGINHGGSYSLSGQDFSVKLDGQGNRFFLNEYCFGGPCNVSLSFEGTFSNFSSLTYNGLTYDFSSNPGFFSMTLNFLSRSQTLNPTVEPSVDSSLPPGFGSQWSYGVTTPETFTMTGFATFVSGGNTIFSLLPFSGSGAVNASMVTDTVVSYSTSTQAYRFSDSPVPEPISTTIAALALMVMIALKSRRVRRRIELG